MGRVVIATLLGLLALGYAAKCPKKEVSPGREIICYTSTLDVKRLEGTICKCTSLIHQGHDIQGLTMSGVDNLRKSLKEINPVLQFIISINDARGILKISANARQEAVARIINIFNEVDGIELNVTAGTKERLVHFVESLKYELTRKSMEKRIILQLPTQAEKLAKQFDIKGLSKYVDLFTLPTHYLMDNDDKYKTFHPSRLMGLFDLLNTDSLVDLVHGLGAAKRKILVSLPASGYKFTLKIKDENKAGDNTENEIPEIINRQELCDSISQGEWTIEKDEDQTAPYAFHDDTWIAFEDEMSAGIKGKYILLRNLAGVAISDVDNDMVTPCGKTLTEYIYHSFADNKRKSREAVLTSLQDDIYNTESSYPENLKSSQYKISRVVDIDGKIHSTREDTQTEFVCERAGFFTHPKSCNRFYRCVQANEEIRNYTVFEFDCPAGLAFDETVQVCVWPGSLSEGSPCPGSPEIAPTTGRRFRCPGDGWFADPQNCRFFFACINTGDHRMMAYEFQCPYGLVYDEEKEICQWPWLATKCAGKNYERNGSFGGSGSDGHGSYGGHGIVGNNAGHGGYDQSNNNDHDKGIPHEGYDESGHGEYDNGLSHNGHGMIDKPTKGGHDEGTSHGGYDESGHGEYDDGSSHHGHGMIDKPTEGGHDGGTSHGGHDESGNGGYDNGLPHNGQEDHGEHDGNTGYEMPTKGGHDEGMSHGHEDQGPPQYDMGSSHNGNGDQKEPEHDEQAGGGYDESIGNSHGNSGGNGNDEEYDKSHDEEFSHKGREESGHGGYDEGSIGGGYNENGGFGSKNQGNYDGPNKHGYDGSSHHGFDDQVTKNDYGNQGGHATSSYTTPSGHSTITHGRFSPSDGAQYTTTGGAYSKGYAGPPTIIFGSDNSQYTTAGQTYSGSDAGRITGQGFNTNGNVNAGFTSSIGNVQTGFGTKTTNSGYSSTIYHNNVVTSDGFNKDENIIRGVTQPGYIQTQPGTSGYVVTNGAKTIYDGSPVPQTSIYDTTSSGLGLGGQSGISIGHSGPVKGSTINFGNGYYTNQTPRGYTGNVVPNGGTFTSGSSTISSGNQYHTNQAGTSYTGGVGGKKHGGMFTPGIPIIANENEYYNSQGGVNQNIGTSRATAFTPAMSVTSPGNRYYTNQAGMTLINNNREIPIKSTVTDGYETNEYHDNGGRGTIKYNNGVVTHKYTEDDVRDHRTSFRIPSSTEVTQNEVFTPVPGGIYTKEGFTKTGPTKTGITTAQLGGTGSYVVGISTSKPPINPDHIGANAFGTSNGESVRTNTQRPPVLDENSNKFDSTVSTQSPDVYENRNIPESPQSPFFNIQVYNTPRVLPSAPITASPAVVNTYSYANPTNVQYQENMYQSSKSSSNSASTGQYFNNPFLNTQRKYPTASPTVQPVGYTTTPLDNYRTTVFEAARIPAAVSTVKPILDNGYQTVISSTPIPVPVETSNYDYNASGTLNNAGKTSDDQFLDVGVSFQQSNTRTPFSSISPGYSLQPSGQNFHQKVTPAVIYQQQSTIKSNGANGALDYTYDHPSGNFGVKTNQEGALPKGSISYQQSTIQPQIYQRPSTVVPYQSNRNYKQGTSPIKGNAGGGYNYPKPDREFIKSSTPIISYTTTRPTEGYVSPTNPSIDHNEVEKFVTKYNRGNVRYTPDGYEEISSDASDSEKFSSKIATTPQPRITTYSGGHKRISTTPKYEINKSTDIGHVKGNGKVIIKLSDLHPILLEKLGAECTCKADPFANFKGDTPVLIDSSNGKVDLRNYDESDVYVDLENSRETELQDYNNEELSTYRSSKISSHETPVIAVFNGAKSTKSPSRPSSTYLPASTPCTPSSNYLPSTTSSPLHVSASDIEASASYFSGAIRSRNGKSIGLSKANTLPTFDTTIDHMNSEEIGVLEMSAEGEGKCARAGLFRHPKFCNKFYVCHWDEWKKKFTLNIFDCPIHLTFDNRMSACNWPSKGPACQDDNIFV